MSNNVVLVTGGSQGLGFAVARQLGEKGATVVVLGRTTESGEKAAGELISLGIDAVGEGADVSDPIAMDALAQRLGPLAQPDVLVCSAGVMSDRLAKTLRTSTQEWHRVMSINLDGVFHAIRVFAPHMATRRSGKVIALSACLGRFSGPGTSGGLAPYRVSKAGLNALIRNFAAEMGWGSRGVLVDCVCPAHCRTAMGGPDAPRSADVGAETLSWLAQSDLAARAEHVGEQSFPLTGLLWEDRAIVPW